jgi:uncharacterized protein YukE
MAGNTEFNTAELTSTANKHTTAAGDINSDRTRLAGQIAELITASPNSMMLKLRDLHDEWDAGLKKITDNLNTMATTLSDAGKTLEAQDQDN